MKIDFSLSKHLRLFMDFNSPSIHAHGLWSDKVKRRLQPSEAGADNEKLNGAVSRED